MGHGKQDVLLGAPCTESEQQLSNIIHKLVGDEETKMVMSTAAENNTVKRQASEETETFSTLINQNCNGVYVGGRILLQSIDVTILYVPYYIREKL